MMRSASAVFILLLIPCIAWSQATSPLNTDADGDQETLFSGDIRHGGYGGPMYGVTFFNGEPTYLRGTRGAWVINLTDTHALNLGLAGYRSATAFDVTEWENDGPAPRLTSRYRGFEMEYVNRSYNLFHFSMQLLVGAGTVEYDDSNVDVDRTRDDHFVLQPGANANLNVTRWFRLTSGVLYRYAAGVSLPGTSTRDLSGLSAYLSLRFGRF